MAVFVDPLLTQVYLAIYERPGATIAQIARRLDEPSRRVRGQVDQLIRCGLVVVDAVTPRRNARERHYRGLQMPTMDEDEGEPWSEAFRAALSFSMMKSIAADIGRALRHRTFGTRGGHAEVRIPGEVDERGWEEIGAIMVGAMQRAEATMIGAAGRLGAAQESGIEVISALLLFEAPGWEDAAERRQGPRPSQWAPAAQGSYLTYEGKADGTQLSPTLRAALVETLGDQLSTLVFIAIVERTEATIAQIAARIGESPRRVRHRVERLLEAGLVVVDAETRRRNSRELHYRATALPTVADDTGSGWDDAQRRRMALSILGAIMADLDTATRGKTLGGRAGNVVIRIPGEVDELGWEELAAITVQTMEAIEATMMASAARLEEAGSSGIEVISTLLQFEGSPWELDQGEGKGPRPSHWRES